MVRIGRDCGERRKKETDPQLGWEGEQNRTSFSAKWKVRRDPSFQLVPTCSFNIILLFRMCGCEYVGVIINRPFLPWQGISFSDWFLWKLVSNPSRENLKVLVMFYSSLDKFFGVLLLSASLVMRFFLLLTSSWLGIPTRTIYCITRSSSRYHSTASKKVQGFLNVQCFYDE